MSKENKNQSTAQSEKPAAPNKAGNEPLTQREGVYIAVMRTLKSSGIEVKKGVAAQTLLTPEHREAIYKLLAQGFSEKRIARIGKTNALWAEDLVPRIDLGAALAGHERVSSGVILPV